MAEYSIYSPFDLEQHKKTYTNYLEVVIDKTGTIMYAVPSHTEKAIAIACAELKVSREQLMAMVPQDYYCAMHEWLCKVAQIVMVWNDGCVFDEPNSKQIAALRRLKLAGVYQGFVPPSKKGEITMERLTRPGIDTDQTAVRFMDGEVKIQNIGDKVLELILNGPTINGVKKDTLRHLVRQLYTELKCYEDAIVPLNPGDSVYWLLEDDGWYISDPEIVADVGTKGFYLSGVRDSAEPGDNPSFVPWAEIGKAVFLSQVEAEAALEKMKEER